MRARLLIVLIASSLAGCGLGHTETKTVTVADGVKTVMRYQYAVHADGCAVPKLVSCEETKITFTEDEKDLSERYEQKGCEWAYPGYDPGVTQSLAPTSNIIDCSNLCHAVTRRFDQPGTACDGQSYTDYDCDLPSGLNGSTCLWQYPVQ